MFSRIISFILTALLCASCALEVGEAPPPKKELVTQKMECVRHVGDKIKQYWSGQFNKDQVITFMNCLVSAVNDFERFTVGDFSDRYSQEEIRNSVQKVVFPDQTISDEFIDSAMHLKTWLSGGDEKFVTRREMRRLQSFLRQLQQVAIDLLPHISVINTHLSEKSPRDFQLQAALEQMRLSSVRLGFWFSQNGGSLNFASLYKFVQEYGKFMNTSVGQDLNYVYLIQTLKTFFVGETEGVETLQPPEMVSCFEQMVNWYGVWLVYFYNIKDKKLLQGEGVEDFVALFDKGLSHLRTAVDQHPTGFISYPQVEAVISGFARTELIPEPFREQSLKSIVRPFFDKIFGDLTVEFAQRRSRGIDRKVVAEIEAEFFRWVEVQRYIQSYFKDKVKSTHNSFSYSDVRFLDLKNLFTAFSLPVGNISELKNVILGIKPLHLPGDPRVVLASETYRQVHQINNNFYQLSLMNVVRAGLRLVIRGYAQRPERIQNLGGLDEAELEQFTESIKLVGEDLNIMPPDLHQVGKKLFLEANTFTYAGDGIKPTKRGSPEQEYVTFNEGAEAISYLYSSMKINSFIYEKLAETCLSGAVDIFGRPLMHAPCFWQNVSDLLENQIANMPEMHKFFHQIRESQATADIDLWVDLQSTLEALIFKPWESRDWVGYIHLGKMVVILHYVETLMTRFDEDENGIIDEDESVKGFPIFEGLLDLLARKRCKELSRNDLVKVFKFILENAEIPSGSLAIIWRDWVVGYDIEVDRLQALKILQRLVVDTQEQESVNCHKINESSKGNWLDDLFRNL